MPVDPSVDYIDFNLPDIWRAAKEGEYEKESRFIHEAILKYYPSARTIIDIGCGSGDHLAILAEKNYQPLGIDLNEKMVTYAQTLFPHLCFELGNMLDYQSAVKFDVVTCLCTTFCCNTSLENIEKALQNFHSLLSDDGLLIIDVFNPAYFLKNDGMPQQIDYNPKAYARHELNALVDIEVNIEAQTIDCVRKISSLKTGRLVAQENYSFRLFFPQELRYFCERNNFTFLSFYGDFDINHQHLDNNRLIIILRKNHL